MSKTKRKTDDRQLNIFDYLKSLSKPPQTTEGRLRIIDQLRVSLRSAIKSCPLSRFEIAGRMSHHLGETITKEMIDSWTRQSDELNGRYRRHIPAEFLPAFCHVTGNNEPLIIMGRLVGLFILPGDEALRAEIQKIDEEIKAAQTRKKRRLMLLEELKRTGE